MTSDFNSLDLILNITCLTSKKNHEEALKLLKKVATMVRPIMKSRGWKTHTLAEFYPKGLLGMNTNRGWKIQLCLRYHSDETQFLPWEEIVGTMLHELAHNIRGPHDAQFYKALNDLNDEYDKIIASGYTGEGFDAVGHRLGTKNGGLSAFGATGRRLGGEIGSTAVTSASRAAAVLAAEKRRQINETMLPIGGRRLGASDSRTTAYTPGELAAMAAERRARDQVWCGSSSTTSSVRDLDAGEEIQDLEGSSSSSPSEPQHIRHRIGASAERTSVTRPKESSATDTSRIKRKVDGNQRQDSGTNGSDKKHRPHPPFQHEESLASRLPTITVAPVAAVTEADTLWSKWTCPACTLLNPPLLLQCECCLTQRPIELDV